MEIEWLSIVGALATGLFLVPIINDYQSKKDVLLRKINAFEFQILETKATIERDKEEEAALNTEMEEKARELAGSENEKNDLQKAVETRMKKKR